jgi:hypothetical protein
MFRNQCDYERPNEMNASFFGSNNTIDNDMNINVDMNPMASTSGGMMTPACPVNPCPSPCPNPCPGPVQQRTVQRTFVHEVPHTCPIHTTVVNNHVFRHTYRPVYTCSEQNCTSHVQCGSCNDFR